MLCMRCLPASSLACVLRSPRKKRANSLCRRAVVYRHIQSHVSCLFVSCIQNHLWHVNVLFWSNYVQPLCGKSSAHVLLACLWLMDCGTLVIVTSSYLCGQRVTMCLSVSVSRKTVSIDKVVFPTSVSLCSLNWGILRTKLSSWDVKLLMLLQFCKGWKDERPFYLWLLSQTPKLLGRHPFKC